MKNLIRVGFAALLLAACTSDPKSPKNTADSVKTVEEKVLVLPYNAEYNSTTQKIDLTHNTVGDASKLSATDMIDAINIKYPEIKLQLDRTSGDTIHLKINDSRYLSQMMGTAGSKSYLAESTYALTEIKGIKAVHFMFSEGDHAAPGVYTRASFNGEVQVK